MELFFSYCDLGLRKFALQDDYDDYDDDDDDVFQDNSTTVQYGGLVSHLANKAKSIVSLLLNTIFSKVCLLHQFIK